MFFFLFLFLFLFIFSFSVLASVCCLSCARWVQCLPFCPSLLWPCKAPWSPRGKGAGVVLGSPCHYLAPLPFISFFISLSFLGSSIKMAFPSYRLPEAKRAWFGSLFFFCSFLILFFFLLVANTHVFSPFLTLFCTILLPAFSCLAGRLPYLTRFLAFE